MAVIASHAPRKIGPHSRRSTLDRISRRSAEYRFLRDVRNELIEHVGGNPNPVTMAVIDRICWLRLRLLLADNRMAEGHIASETESKSYLAHTNSLRLLLDALPEPPARPDDKPTLGQYLAGRTSASPSARLPVEPLSSSEHMER